MDWDSELHLRIQCTFRYPALKWGNNRAHYRWSDKHKCLLLAGYYLLFSSSSDHIMFHLPVLLIFTFSTWQRPSHLKSSVSRELFICETFLKTELVVFSFMCPVNLITYTTRLPYIIRLNHMSLKPTVNSWDHKLQFIQICIPSRKVSGSQYILNNRHPISGRKHKAGTIHNRGSISVADPF